MEYLSRIKDILARQFAKVLGSDPDFYGETEVILSNEQQFVRERDRKPHAIYIVWKALPATINFGSVVQPITIQAMGEMNGISKCQRLLNEFANTYNLAPTGDDGIKQTYTSPSVGTSFAEAWSGYRSLYFMSGTFLASEGMNAAKIEFEGSEVPAITSNISASYSLDTQMTYASSDFTRSKTIGCTVSVGLSMYMTDDGLCLRALRQMAGELPMSTVYPITLRWANGISIAVEARLSSMDISESVGALPIVQMTLTA